MSEVLTKACTRCKKDRPLDAFGLRKRKSGTNVHSWCKSCCTAAARESHAKNPELNERRWHDSHLRRRYGITLKQYEQLLVDQNGGCKLCGSKVGRQGTQMRLCVDHDHKTGRVRGLLCGGCNGALGQFGDDEAGLLRALSYLRGDL